MNWHFFWPNVLVLLLSLLFLTAIKARLDIRELSTIRIILILAVVRDTSFALLGEPTFLYFGDLVLFTGVLVWLRRYGGFRRDDGWFLGFVLLSVPATFLVMLHPQANTNWLFLIVNLYVFSYLTRAFLYTTVYNTPGAEIIEDGRWYLIVGIGLAMAAGTLTGYRGTPMHQASIIAFYIAIWLILLTEFQIFHLMNELTIASLHRQNRNLFGFLKGLGEGIANRVDISQLLDMVTEHAVKTIGADGGMLVMMDESMSHLMIRSMTGFYPPPIPVPEAVRHRSESFRAFLESQPVPLRSTVVGSCVREREAIFIPDTREDDRLARNPGTEQFRISSFIAVPLIVDGTVTGVISLIRTEGSPLFTHEDFGHAQTFAYQASNTIENFARYLEAMDKRRIEREVEIAAEIQGDLVGSPDTRRAGFDISILSRPARGVSGDYYNFFRLSDELLGCAICDVAGKGIPAALVMVMIHSILKLVAAPGRSAAETLELVNQGISGQLDVDHFATMSYCTIHRRTGHMEYSNAAHHPVMIYRAETGEIEELDTPGIPVGIEPSVEYACATTELKEGDVLVFFTDGIVEAINSSDEQFTNDRLVDAIQHTHGQSADAIRTRIQETLDHFVGHAPQHDDQTLLVIRFTAE
ncbi:MAG: PP2C family protein-serine/threonine phosphatase [Spirochaetaceae bacterium]